MYFVDKVDCRVKRKIVRVLNVKEGRRPFKCLGLFLDGKRLPLKYFGSLLEKVRTKLSGWKNKALSFTGRITLRKSRLQSLSTFVLASGWVPSGVLDKLERNFRFFFWGKERRSRGLEWAFVLRRNTILLCKLRWQLDMCGMSHCGLLLQSTGMGSKMNSGT